MLSAAHIDSAKAIPLEDLRHIWPILSLEDRVQGFRLLSSEDAEDLFLSLNSQEHAELLTELPSGERKIWMRQLDPDDAADAIQAADRNLRSNLLSLCDERTRREVTALLAYEEDSAGGLMSPRFALVRAESTVDEAISYLRRQARNQLETIYYAYALDANRKLVGVVSFRELFAAKGGDLVKDILQTDVVMVHEDTDQEEVARLMSVHDLMAIPVVNDKGEMKGIITFDDVVDVVEEETTEDMQKMGGMEALETSYLQTGLFSMVRKRGVWLSVLLIGEMLTATAMGFYQDQLSRAVILTLFIPLIISSGGNSGSQATTLIIRALALGEVRLKDWWRVVWRELLAGLCLGAILGVIGLARILISESFFGGYGDHYALVGMTVALSLVAVVTWGTVTGSTLPFILSRLGFDPASASAPFVATLVDVFGLVIYFSVAGLFLTGTLL